MTHCIRTKLPFQVTTSTWAPTGTSTMVAAMVCGTLQSLQPLQPSAKVQHRVTSGFPNN